MATINPVKLRQEAEKFERGGKFEQAIAAYTKLAEENRSDWSLTNKIGDLHARLGNTREASVCFGRVAEHLASEGFHLKAIAIWKKINKLDASVFEPYLQLGALYVKQGLMVEAKAHYLFVAEEQVKKNRIREAIDVLRRVSAIDPVDVKIRGRLAELLRRDGKEAEAADEFVGLADDLRAKGRSEDAVKVIEAALRADPSRSKLRLSLAQIRMDLGDSAGAAKIFDEARESSSDDPDVLRALAEGYLRLDRVAEAEEALRKLLLLQPDDLDMRAQLARVLASRGRAEEAYDEALPLVERLIEQRSGARAASILETLSSKDPSHVPTLARLTEIYRLIHKDSEASSAYARLATAYETASADDKAIEILEMLVSREPGKPEYQQRLTDLRRKAGHPEPGAEEADNEMAGVLRDVSVPIPSNEARPGIRQTRGLTDVDKEYIEEHLSEGRVYRKYGLMDKAVEQLMQVITRFPDNVSARVELRDILRQQGDDERASEQSMALAEISRMTGDQAAAAAHEADGRGSGEIPVLAEPAVLEIEVPATPVVVEEDVPFALAEEGPALELNVESTATERPPIAEPIAAPPVTAAPEIDWVPAPATSADDIEIEFPQPEAAPVLAPPPLEVDHTPEPLESLEALEGHRHAPPVTVEDDLGALFGLRPAADDGAATGVSPQIGEAGLAEMFREFRKGVDEQLGAEDHDTRYNLGIAYKEMGLLDEAIAEFTLAAEDPRRSLECMSMLGLCFMEKGSPKEAAAWFEKGLAVSGRTPEEYRGLEYDLAAAYEASGEKKKALDQFARIAKRGAFRDVASRMRKLRAEVS